MRVYLSHSSTILVETDDVRIVCDPWYSEPIFDGGWLLPEATPSDKWLTDLLGNGLVDYIFVSHIHPDHYDSRYLTWLENEYQIRLLIADWSSSYASNHLKSKMIRDGFSADCIYEANSLNVGHTNISIFPWDTGSGSDVDSAITITCSKSNACVVNLNDCIYHPDNLHTVSATIPHHYKKLVLASYSPAGSYPHTYLNLRGRGLESEARNFRERFLSEYSAKCAALSGDYGVPCAGGFRYAIQRWNRKSGRPSYSDAISRFQAPSGLTGYDSVIELSSHGDAKAFHKCSPAYQRQILSTQGPAPASQHTDKDLVRLISSSYTLACERIRTDESYTYIIIIKGYGTILLPINGSGIRFLQTEQLRDFIRSNVHTIHILAVTQSLLYRLLTGAAHWDNAEKGSLYNSFRSPNKYSRTAQSWLHYFYTRC